MGQIAHRLHHLLVFHARHFIEQNSKDDGQREAEHEVQAAENQRVFDGLIKRLRAKQPVEVFHPHPRAAPDALEHAVFLKGNHQPAHRRIAENGIPQHHRQQQQIRRPVLPQPIAQPFPAQALCLRNHPIIPSILAVHGFRFCTCGIQNLIQPISDDIVPCSPA